MILKRISPLLLAAALAALLAVSAGAEGFQPIWPVTRSRLITVLNTFSDGRIHHGIDIAADGDDHREILAVADGWVEYIYDDCSCDDPLTGCLCGEGWGNSVVIHHVVDGEDYYSRYGHMTQYTISVELGQFVSAGDVIGRMGSSGNSWDYHLHLELYKGISMYDRFNSYSPATRSFDYYVANPSLLAGARISIYNADDAGDAYRDWILAHGTRSGNYYVINRLS